ncbi:hypothetical protein HanPSC8_Chr03g0103311 [Helianthus annuus]|nr:hypothetical protein HanPSC8_Chr03g0103311 [Helianthus annuus]
MMFDGSFYMLFRCRRHQGIHRFEQGIHRFAGEWPESGDCLLGFGFRSVRVHQPTSVSSKILTNA